MNIGERFKLFRQERNLTFDDVARVTGVSAATLYRIEHGRACLYENGIKLDQLMSQQHHCRIGTRRPGRWIDQGSEVTNE